MSRKWRNVLLFAALSAAVVSVILIADRANEPRMAEPSEEECRSHCQAAGYLVGKLVPALSITPSDPRRYNGPLKCACH